MDPSVKIELIAAVSENGVIGHSGKLPWQGKLPADMARFRDLTVGHNVIMGRKTWESLPKRFRPLPNRHNMVVTRQPKYNAPGATVCGSLEEAVRLCRPDGRVFVIGGATLYREALPLTSVVHLTIVHERFEGDTSFPELDILSDWNIIGKTESEASGGNQFPHTFMTLTRRTKSHVNLEHARSDEQLEVMKTIDQKGVCPFCPENLSDYHKKPILLEGDYWLLTENQWPYENTRVHLLLIHKEHAEKLGDLSPEAWSELGELVTWAEGHFKVKGGGIGIRFGDPSLNRGTVRHLHVQFLTARTNDENDPNYKPVRLKLG